MGRHELVLEKTVPAPADAIWAVLEDMKRYPEWMSHVTEVERNGTGPLKKGTKFTVHTTIGRHLLVTDMVVAEATRPTRLVWTHTKELLDGKPLAMVEGGVSEFGLEPKGKGTRVRAVVSFEAVSLTAKLAANYFLQHKIKPQMEASIEALARRALAEAKA